MKKTVYSVRYFKAGGHFIIGDARIESELFYPLKNDGAIETRYLHENSRHLPQGSRLSSLYTFFAVFGFILGLGALIVVIEMIVNKIRNQHKHALV